MRKIEQFLNRQMPRRDALKTAIEIASVAAVGGGLVGTFKGRQELNRAIDNFQELHLANGCPEKLTEVDRQMIKEATIDQTTQWVRTGDIDQAGFTQDQREAFQKYDDLYAAQQKRIDFYDKVKTISQTALSIGGFILASDKAVELVERRRIRNQ